MKSWEMKGMRRLRLLLTHLLMMAMAAANEDENFPLEPKTGELFGTFA
jgi:hypothetical protein